MTCASPLRSRRHGFSLAELMLVIVIAGLIAAFAGPRLVNFVRYFAARSDTSQLVADLALARTQAVREGQTASLRVLSSTRYTVTVDRAGQPPRVIKNVTLTGARRGVTLAAPAGPRVAFDSRGMLRPGMGNLLVVQSARRSDTVSITGVGRVYRGN